MPHGLRGPHWWWKDQLGSFSIFPIETKTVEAWTSVAVREMERNGGNSRYVLGKELRRFADGLARE